VRIDFAAEYDMSNNSSRPRSSGGKKREEKRSGRRKERGFRKGKPEKKGPRFQSEELEGTVAMTREGFAFIIVEGREDDIFVPAHRLRGALNGDRVKVVTTRGRGQSGPGKFRRTDGEVIHIIERSKKPHIGLLQVNHRKREAWVIMESKVMPYDISIPFEEIDSDALNGLKVAVLVTGFKGRL